MSYGGKARTVDFCSRPSDIATALACEAGKFGAELVIDAAVDAYNSTSRKNTPKRIKSDKNLLTELSDSDICQGAYGRKNGLASHQYVAKHRKLDCLDSYLDANLCEAILKKKKLMSVSLHHANSTGFRKSLSKMQTERNTRGLDC
ncbi:hypothetical protein OAN83_02885 [Alphaproteobacteria bacterium]|nr:hypothetical protein [Alphaproteobacteria bacterium]